MNPDKLTDVQLALRPHRITGPVMAQFLDAAAIQPRAAIRFRPGSAAAEAEFRRLLASGALKNYGDGYWFDLRAHYAARRAREVRWMIGSVAAALAIAVVAVMFYQG
jgi:hypothetical protein